MNVGEIWKVDLVDTTGHEQEGIRPALVIAVDNQAHLCTIIPMTRTLRYLELFSNTYRIIRSQQNGLGSDSVALIFQVRSLDFRRFIGLWGNLEANTFSRIKILLRQYLDI